MENLQCGHILSGFFMSTVLSSNEIGNKHDSYRAKDCMKMFCEFLREYAFTHF